jgi:hypothetical protein
MRWWNEVDIAIIFILKVMLFSYKNLITNELQVFNN